MPGEERQRLLLDALADHVDEEVVAVGVARREHGRRKPPFARRLGRGGHPADRIGDVNLLVLTPTRVMVFAGREKESHVEVRGLAGAWPVEDVRLEAHHLAGDASYDASGGLRRSSDPLIRATLTWVGENRPLILDLPAGAASRAAVNAIRQATAQRART